MIIYTDTPIDETKTINIHFTYDEPRAYGKRNIER